MVKLGRIEIAGQSRLLARFFVDDGSSLRSVVDVDLAGLASSRFDAMEPPHAEGEDDDRRDDAQTGRREGRGAEVRHRNGVVDRRRSRQHRHGESECAEAYGGWHQPSRDVRGSEKLPCHWHQHEEGDKDADATIGDHGRGEHDGKHRASYPQLCGQETRDRGDRTAIVHELAEQPAKQEHGEPLRDKASRATHEGLRPMGEKRFTRDRSGQERSRRGHQQYAPPSVRKPHQQAEREQYPNESHGSVLCPTNEIAG